MILVRESLCEMANIFVDLTAMVRRLAFVKSGEWELTKRELEEMEEEKRKIEDAEAKKQFLEKQNRISEEEPSIPYNKNDERIITRDGKKFKQWFWVGSGSDIWYDETEIVDEC